MVADSYERLILAACSIGLMIDAHGERYSFSTVRGLHVCTVTGLDAAWSFLYRYASGQVNLGDEPPKNEEE